MKRKWSSTAGLVDLGLPRSALRAPDSAGSDMEVAERASADVRRAGIAQTGVGLPGVPDARVNATAALGQPNMGLAGEGLKGILGSRRSGSDKVAINDHRVTGDHTS